MIDHGQDHYLVLDLAPSATDAEIKQRYRALMRTVHPDANVHDPEATRKAAAINRAFETSLAEGIRFERRMFHSLFATDDQKEGMAAFVEKRAPDFKNR